MAERRFTAWAVIGREKNGEEWLADVKFVHGDAITYRDRMRGQRWPRPIQFVLRPVSASIELKVRRARA